MFCPHCHDELAVDDEERLTCARCNVDVPENEAETIEDLINHAKAYDNEVLKVQGYAGRVRSMARQGYTEGELATFLLELANRGWCSGYKASCPVAPCFECGAVGERIEGCGGLAACKTHRELLPAPVERCDGCQEPLTDATGRVFNVRLLRTYCGDCGAAATEVA